MVHWYDYCLGVELVDSKPSKVKPIRVTIEVTVKARIWVRV